MKYFRDAVHGRLPVAKEYCKHIIDTLQFQRLKRIEQTSMRDLYPSAHHDRFIHSIGTYHIGRIMGEQIKNNDFAFNDLLNAADILNSSEKIKLNSVIKNFEVACLLHDCGHAPFSHTFENCFKYVEGYETDMIQVVIEYIVKQICAINSHSYSFEMVKKELNNYFIGHEHHFDESVKKYIRAIQEKEKTAILRELKNEIDALDESIEEEEEELNIDNKKTDVYVNFEKFVEKTFPKYKRYEKIQRLFRLLLEYFIDSSLESPKPHEIVSSWLVLHENGFGKTLQEEMQLDPLLIARMICGYRYHEFDKPTYCEDSKKNEGIKEILNCFISLLNGKVIDADKLDYCLRDKWASGVNVNNIEISKLLQSLSIRTDMDDKIVVCFSKGAIPEIESVIDSKNKVAYWCHNHNKIVYRQELLKNAVEKLAVIFAPKEQKEEYQYLKRCRHELTVECDSSTIMKVYNKDWSYVGKSEGCYSLIEKHLRSESSANPLHEFIKICRGKIEQDNIGKIFNYHSFISPQVVTISIGKYTFHERLSLISDDDIICLLKKFLLLFSDSEFHDGESELEKEFRNDASKYVKDLLSRSQDLIPLWKSRAEFISDFKNLVLEEESTLPEDIEKKLKEVVARIKDDDGKELYDKNIPCRVISKKMTIASIAKDEIYINTGGRGIYCYTTLEPISKSEPATVNFVYAFVPKVRNKKGSVRSINKDIYREILESIKSEE